jgi:hypothetical protein
VISGIFRGIAHPNSSFAVVGWLKECSIIEVGYGVRDGQSSKYLTLGSD